MLAQWTQRARAALHNIAVVEIMSGRTRASDRRYKSTRLRSNDFQVFAFAAPSVHVILQKVHQGDEAFIDWLMYLIDKGGSLRPLSLGECVDSVPHRDVAVLFKEGVEILIPRDMVRDLWLAARAEAILELGQ